MKGVSYKQHANTNRIYYGFTETFLTDDQDKSTAYETCDTHRLRTSVHSTAPNAPIHVSIAPTHQARNTLPNLLRIFREEERYTGRLGEEINEFFQNYTDTCRDLEYTISQKHRFFHVLFDGEEMQFYQNKVQDVCHNFQEARMAICNNFRSIARQRRLRKILHNNRLTDISLKLRRYQLLMLWKNFMRRLLLLLLRVL